jgi:hypothetical protein
MTTNEAEIKKLWIDLFDNLDFGSRKKMNHTKFEDLLAMLEGSVSCPSCGLHGKLMDCPKCGRKACDKCVAVDKSDCMFCGPHGEIAKECFAPFHARQKG